MEHLDSLNSVKVDAEALYRELVSLFEKIEIPWKNLCSILMDSCAVMRGAKGSAVVFFPF